jgi:hypothetical protein
MTTPRPLIRDLERSGAEIVLEVLALAGIVAILAMAAIYYWKQAETSRDPGGLIQIVALSVVIYAGMTLASRFPHRFNYPWAITEVNARRQYTLSRRMLTMLKLAVVLLFIFMTLAELEAAMGKDWGLAIILVVVLQIPILGTIVGSYIVKASRET